MLPIDLKPVFLRFFSEIDRYTSYEVTQTKGHVGELATTGKLLRCLELDDNIEPPDGLRVTPIAFREELAKVAEHLPGCPDVGFEIEAEGFGQNFEGRVTQADYAIRLSYRDTSIEVDVARSLSWDAFYFFQAKIAKTPGPDKTRNQHVWASDAVFGVTHGQHSAIKSAREILGNGLIYNLYCPLRALEIDESAKLYRKLREYFTEQPEEWNQARSAGLWISQNLPSTLGELLNSNDNLSRPWVLFLMDHYFSIDSHNTWSPELMYCDINYPDDSELMRRKMLFERNPKTIEFIQNHLIDQGVRKKNKSLGTFANIGYRPRIKISLKFPGYDYVNTPMNSYPGP